MNTGNKNLVTELDRERWELVGKYETEEFEPNAELSSAAAQECIDLLNRAGIQYDISSIDF